MSKYALLFASGLLLLLVVISPANAQTGQRQGGSHDHAASRSGENEHRAGNLRPVRRASGPLHLRRHLGREDSAIPNTRGIRNDVVAALKKSTCAGRCAGRAAALPTSITGRTASARARSGRR